jgi:hypothetical protein
LVRKKYFGIKTNLGPSVRGATILVFEAYFSSVLFFPVLALCEHLTGIKVPDAEILEQVSLFVKFSSDGSPL